MAQEREMSSTSQTLQRLKPTLTAALLGAAVGASIALRRHASGGSVHSFHDFVAAGSRRGFSPGMLISIGMWVVFSIYWEIAAKNTSEVKRSESRISRGVHLALISIGQILIFLPVPGLRARFLPQSTALITVSLIFQLGFFAFAVWARQMLGRNWSGAVTAKLDHELVRTGPYRFVRHPIYSALLGIYATTALISGEVHGLAGVGIVCLAYWRKIGMEEAYMRELFGADYSRYQQETAAVIPGVL